MARDPLPVGTWGNINESQIRPGSFKAEARYRLASGKTVKVSGRGKSKSAANSKLSLKIKDLDKFDGLGDITPKTTVAELAEFWLGEKKIEGIAANTIRGYLGVTKNHITPAIGALRLRECRTSQIDRLLKNHASRGASTHKLRVVLHQMFDLARRHDALDRNPVEGVTSFPKPTREVIHLTLRQVAEVRELIATAMVKKRPGPRMSNLIPDLFDLMLGTGIRLGEALALRWEDLALDGEMPTITISGTIRTETGKGTFRKNSPKTPSGFRTIPIPGSVVTLLRRRNDQSPTNPHGAVFATRNGTWVQTANLHNQWNRVLDGTAYSWVTSHVLRKSVGTLVGRATNREVAKELLGHADSRVTDESYINMPSLAPDVTEYLEQFRRPNVPATDTGVDPPAVNPQPQV